MDKLEIKIGLGTRRRYTGLTVQATDELSLDVDEDGRVFVTILGDGYDNCGSMKLGRDEARLARDWFTQYLEEK